MFSQIIIFLLVVVGIASIHSLPIKEARRSVSATGSSSTVTISKSVLNMLTKVDTKISKGLLPVFFNADSLSDDQLFIPEVAKSFYTHAQIFTYSFIFL